MFYKKFGVAIPYKSGKYSYINNLIDLNDNTIYQYVAIPYKSGKYSYGGDLMSWKFYTFYCRNPL